MSDCDDWIITEGIFHVKNKKPAQTQKSVENIYGRSVRFDVFATDDTGKLYNIGVQRTDAGAVPTRARYNSSMLDYHKLKKKAKYDELPETYVIFFTENDVLKSGEKIYHIDRVIRETQKLFEDGTHIIYVNGSFKGESGKPLDDLIHDFFCSNPEEMRHRQLAERVEFLKSNKSGVRKMSKIIQEVFAEEIAAGIAAGKAEEKKATLLENIRNLMETLNLTAQQAMDALKIPANEQEKYIALI